jgi:uncharacterized metal-binding protein YceD (DUF177 family)
MGQNRAFEIAFVGLTPGDHVFEYRIEDKFFVDFGPQDFSNCDTSVKLQLEKNQGFMQLHFDVDGRIDTLCDRCGNPLTVQLWDEFNLIIKLVDNPEEMNSNEEDPDIYYIDRNESHITVASWIYEFINLSIPLQHICKENEKGESSCNQEVLAELSKLIGAPIEVPNENIWKGLDQFKGLDMDDETNSNDVDSSNKKRETKKKK